MREVREDEKHKLHTIVILHHTLEYSALQTLKAVTAYLKYM